LNPDVGSDDGSHTSYGCFQPLPPRYTEEEFRQLLIGIVKQALSEIEQDPQGFTQRYIAHHYGGTLGRPSGFPSHLRYLP
jgi:hypothetical protein